MKNPASIVLITLLLSCIAVKLRAFDVDYSRDVLPILSDKCFVCHGPDAEEGTLRLDLVEEATKDLGGYRAVDADSPSKSELLVRIHSSDDPMPPSDARKQLTEIERDILDQWVRSGGSFGRHWAFEKPLARADHDGRSPRQIDELIEERLRTRSIDFAEPADRPTLARRVSLVLTGLPPNPDLLKRFLSDDSDGAYERLVDQILASSQFGEHQARYWLDAVRYGDTHGLHLDNRRGIFAYRDWVVRALNENLPLDQFIRWQIAGDLLPDATLAQKVATGFVRLNPSTGEGGAISEEFQAKNNFDRVETLGTVFLGLSLTCARCHNHKYDPITQRDYYRLMAYFNSTAEPALDGNSYTYGPTVKAPKDQSQWTDWNRLEGERSRLLKAARTQWIGDDLESKLVSFAQSTEAWTASDWKMTKPMKAGDPMPEIATGETKASGVWSSAKGIPGRLSGRSARGKLPGKDQVVWVRVHLQSSTDQSFIFNFSGEEGSTVIIDGVPVLAGSRASAGEGPGSGPKIRLLSIGAGEHSIIFKIVGGAAVDALEIGLRNPWDSLAKSRHWSSTPVEDRLWMLADVNGPFKGSTYQDHAVRLAADLSLVESEFTTTLVAKELPNRRVTRVLRRGEYNLPIGEDLKPGVIPVLNPVPPDAPSNRLGLAAWLTSSENPLVARVLVNRIWQRTFGSALVRTPEDFGLQGNQPTHPKLLDWLAVELQRSGWDLKHLLRLLVTSRTFKQRSAWREHVDDPENLLFARGPSFRLDAEVLRDIGLWASGLLNPKMGGEGVKPYQPSGMWLALAHPASNTKLYEMDRGEKLYRRSLYVYWKRTSPHPMMTLFDAPDRESSCVRRSRTNTALQSLAMFNETQRVEMGRKLAERLLGEHQGDEDRLLHLFTLVACRGPDDSEQKACRDLLQKMRDRYRDAAEEAESLISVGEAPRDETFDVAELAAWTQVAIVVLASDTAIMLY